MTTVQAGTEGLTPRQGGSAVVGLGLIAGALAQSQSAHYGEDESSALRITAHATIPFFVLANALTDRVGGDGAILFRGGFLGAHLIHLRAITRLVRAHGTDELLIRAELAGGAPLYLLIVLQAALLSPPVQRRLGSDKAERLRRGIDTQLLRVYCLATATGLARYRRPLPVYAGLATLLAAGFAARGGRR